ncbi:MAG: asparagine synthase [Gammaproteobacteria bacterium]|nr:asparagine synthase [Gammaproteobacteria bacterium]
MWLEIELDSFNVQHHGFIEKKLFGNILYVSPGFEHLQSARDLIRNERGIAIEININKQKITFGRDYLGQYPLLFMHTDNKLFLTDDILHIDWWSRKNDINLTLSEEALALYFSFGYIPQDMTAFNEVKSCKNITLYHCSNNSITEENVFVPIEETDNCHINDVGEYLFEEATKLANDHQRFDVWCSGGIDSSAMAYCFSHNGRSSDILTLGYDEDALNKFGDGEIQYAKEIARHCQSPLRYAQLSSSNFIHLHKQFTSGHNGPVIDTCVIAKYALAQATLNTAITGEGGDPVFGGVKNTNVLFAHSQHPRLALGWLYAYAHRRFFNRLDDIFIHGNELADYVVEYLNKKFEFYPGDLLRKLFYLNTIEKQGGMIFPQSYYPGKRYGISIHHPLTNLSVYQSAFHLKDEKRYIYPDGKLVLTRLFRNKIPESIIKRKKSGTIIPLRNFMEKMPANYFDVTELKSSGYFNEKILGKIDTYADNEPQLLIYGFITLNKWLLNRKGVDHE